MEKKGIIFLQLYFKLPNENSYKKKTKNKAIAFSEERTERMKKMTAYLKYFLLLLEKRQKRKEKRKKKAYIEYNPPEIQETDSVSMGWTANIEAATIATRLSIDNEISKQMSHTFPR